MTTPEQRRHLLPPELPVQVPRNPDSPSHSSDNPPTEQHDVVTNSRSERGRRWRRRLVRTLSLMASPITDDTGDIRSVAAGLLSLFLVGASIGLSTPKNHSLPSIWYQNVSAAVGYIYFLAWSVSFYPQVVSNFKRQSTLGLSPDFCVLNLLGFACYSAYNASFFWSPTIQEMYRIRHGPDAKITVQSNDVAFAIHALILSSVTVLQIVYYGGGIVALRVSKPIVLVIAGILTVCIIYPMLIWITHGEKLFNWLDFLYLLSFVKIGISLIKYIPQVILNKQRASTVGWSIWNILLDFTGGCLSILQLVLDCANMHDFSGITGNPAKFGLGFVSIFFDLIFIVQHYCLYANNNNRTSADSWDEQQEPLLSADARGEAESRASNEAANHSPDQPEIIMV
ncbi:lysosomal cystine family transporter [Nitzschia inconspicua]|uniref:Lysosomal cystine family transporter n=1 Tax=Nitzschia inconspicua TaxID=303405 RepID=A0A9K3Q3P8_9STRA|nr:lysosomal cystine family transporter [Nitzschia inconspicua]